MLLSTRLDSDATLAPVPPASDRRAAARTRVESVVGAYTAGYLTLTELLDALTELATEGVPMTARANERALRDLYRTEANRRAIETALSRPVPAPRSPLRAFSTLRRVITRKDAS